MEQITFEQIPQAISELLEKVKSIEEHLQGGHMAAPGTDQTDLISIAEAAKVLNLSISTIYGKVCRNEIPVNKRGKRLYFDRKELIEWIKAGKRKTVSELKESLSRFNRGRGKFNSNLTF